jgi:hypothetical protein
MPNSRQERRRFCALQHDATKLGLRPQKCWCLLHTENPCVGGSIPPLGTILPDFFKKHWPAGGKQSA